MGGRGQALASPGRGSSGAWSTRPHVELRIYGGNFYSDVDLELCRQFHARPWERRSEIVSRFSDQRLKRLARRLIYLETPHLLDNADRRTIADDISARRRGEGKHASPPWTTIAQALLELEIIDAEVSTEFKKCFLELIKTGSFLRQGKSSAACCCGAPFTLTCCSVRFSGSNRGQLCRSPSKKRRRSRRLGTEELKFAASISAHMGPDLTATVAAKLEDAPRMDDVKIPFYVETDDELPADQG